MTRKVVPRLLSSFLISVIWLGGSICANGAERQVPYSESDIHRYFDDFLVFGRNASNTPIIRKWNVPLQMEVFEADREKENNILAVIKTISERTGVRIERKNSEQKPNVLVSLTNSIPDELIGKRRSIYEQFFPSDAEYERFRLVVSPTDACISATSFTDNTIKYGLFILDTSKDAINTKPCLEQQFTKILGLKINQKSVLDSIFTERYQSLTELDEYALKILYDPRIKSGMTIGEFFLMVDQILKQGIR